MPTNMRNLHVCVSMEKKHITEDQHPKRVNWMRQRSTAPVPARVENGPMIDKGTRQRQKQKRSMIISKARECEEVEQGSEGGSEGGS